VKHKQTFFIDFLACRSVLILVIETLLCYLELHSKKWIENLQPIFANCSVHFYGGRAQMLAVAKKVFYSFSIGDSC